MKTKISLKVTVALFCTIMYMFAQTQCVNCPGSSNNEENSSAIGVGSISEGNSAFASGFESKAIGNYSTAMGFGAWAVSSHSIALGKWVKTTGAESIVIGGGVKNANIYLENNDGPSLMIGFGSRNPTFFVSPTYSSDPYFVKTGRIAIGNIRNSNGYLDPQAKLHLRADEGEAALMLIEPYRWVTGQEGIIALGSMQNNIRGKNNSGLIFNSESNFLFKNGRVGIGELTQPQAKLHIKGSKFETPNIFIEPFRQEIGKGASQAGLYLGDFEHGISYNSAVGLMYLTANNHVFQGGNVGIGIAEPTAMFHVEDNLGSFKYLDAKAVIGGKADLASLVIENNNGYFSISKMDDMLAFMNNDGFQMGLSDTYGLTANKHITVGTLANKAGIWPGAGINVVQDGTENQKAAEFITEEGGRIFFVPRLGNNGSYCPSTVKGDAGIFWSGTTNQNNNAGFVIGPHDTDNWIHGLRINHEGNVGIGLAHPEARLHIKGGWNDKTFIITNSDGIENFAIKATGETLINNRLWATEIMVATENPWPDYVFNDTYSLPSLSEVEAYINENKHLPDVPSQDEVLENGINVAEMDAILLQKIEELTLYVIELEKKVEKLEKEKVRE